MQWSAVSALTVASAILDRVSTAKILITTNRQSCTIQEKIRRETEINVNVKHRLDFHDQTEMATPQHPVLIMRLKSYVL